MPSVNRKQASWKKLKCALAPQFILRTNGFRQFVISFLGWGFTACSLNPNLKQYQPTVTTCILPADQTNTIQGHWKAQPIPIAFHQNDFASEEVQPMTSAADTWNTFFTASKKITLFDYGGSSPTLSNQADPLSTGSLCALSIIQNTKFTGSMVIYKLGTWPSAYSTSAIALTTFCTYKATPYAYMYMAVMEINYQNFFVSGQKLPDLQSIVLHELGHVLGLKHSCEANGTNGMPNCTDPNLDASYADASMYPIFGFDSNLNGQQKRSLGTNDEGRANCLY